MTSVDLVTLETILRQLLVPDNDAISAATEQLNLLSRDRAARGCIIELSQVLRQSQYPEARNVAAVLLRRRIVRHWARLTPQEQEELKASYLESLLAEPELQVQHATANVVSVIAKFDIPCGQWPQLLAFLYDSCRHQEDSHRVVGMYVLSKVADAAAEQLEPHYASLFELFLLTLNDSCLPVSMYTINTLTALVPHLGSEQLPAFRNILDVVLAALTRCLQENELLAIEPLQLFDELADSEVPLISKHVPILVQFCIQMGSANDLDGSIRVKAFSFITWLIIRRSKALAKKGQIPIILQAVFAVMCSEHDMEVEAETAEDCLGTYVAQVIDALATQVPPEIIFPLVANFIQTHRKSGIDIERKAVFVALYAIIEGTSHYIELSGHLEELLSVTLEGIQDANVHIRKAACISLSSIAEHCQPEVGNFHAQVLPPLLEILSNAEFELQERACYAVEQLVNHLDGDTLQHYIGPLMERLMLMTGMGNEIHQIAISCIGVVAQALPTIFAENYVGHLYQHVKQLMTIRNVDQYPLLLQAIDTMGCLVRCCRQRTLELDGHIKDCTTLALNLMNETTDVDARVACYGMFVACAEVAGESYGEYLPHIMPHVFKSCEAGGEGITKHGKEAYAFLQDEDSDDDDIDNKNEVNTGDLQEQEAAVNVLGLLAEYIRAPFVPYLQSSFKVCDDVIQKLDQSPANVRKAMLTSFAQLVIAAFVVSFENPDDAVPGAPLDQGVQQVADHFMITILSLLTEEWDKSVVACALVQVDTVLCTLGSGVLEREQARGELYRSLESLLKGETACQGDDFEDSEDEDGGAYLDDDDQQMAELEEVVIENTCEAIVATSKALGSQFQEALGGFLPLLATFTKRQAPVNQRSMAVGNIAEIVEAMGGYIAPYATGIMEIIIPLHCDEDPEVRSNSAYATGVICQYGSEQLSSKLPAILASLYKNCIENVTSEMGGVIDNACGAVARMILGSPARVPVDQILSVVVTHLPLRQDGEEYEPIYKLFLLLLTQFPESIRPFVAHITAITAQLLMEQQQHLSQDVIGQMRIFLQHVTSQFQGELQSLPEEQQKLAVFYAT